MTSLLSKFVSLFIIAGFIFFCHGNKQAVTTGKFNSSLSNTEKLLQGSWFGKEYDEHAVFNIDGDSINYIEHFDKFKYRISKDTFDILTDQPHYKEIILKLTKDSLVLKELPGNEINKYWKSN
jgi:hypothetical protein